MFCGEGLHFASRSEQVMLHWLCVLQNLSPIFSGPGPVGGRGVTCHPALSLYFYSTWAPLSYPHIPFALFCVLQGKEEVACFCVISC